jgi:hypothetical protein
MGREARVQFEPGGFDAGEPMPDQELREVDPELPEADAIDQHRSVPDDVDEEVESIPVDASEADVLDQARVVHIEEEP